MSRDKSPERWRRATRPNAQPFDEINIVVVPRFKESEVSGDEWRTVARMQFKHKGTVLHESHYHTVKHAVMCASYNFLNSEDGRPVTEDDSCDQESCTAPSTVAYKVKMLYDRAGHADDPYKFDKRPLVRKFCAKHAVRGDCALEDADPNYELLESKPSTTPPPPPDGGPPASASPQLD